MAHKKIKKKKKKKDAQADAQQTNEEKATLSRAKTGKNVFSLGDAQGFEDAASKETGATATKETKEEVSSATTFSNVINGEDPWVIQPLQEHLAIIAHSVHAPLQDSWETVILPRYSQGTQDDDSDNDDNDDDDNDEAEENVEDQDGDLLVPKEHTISFLSIPTKASALKGDVNNNPESGSAFYFIQTRDRAPCSYYLWLRVYFVAKNRVHGLIVQPGDTTTCAPIKWRLDTLGVPDGWHWQLCPFSFRLARGITRLQIAFCSLGVRVLSLWLSRSEGQFPPNYRGAPGSSLAARAAAANKLKSGVEQQSRLFKCGKTPWLDPQFRAPRDPYERRSDRSQRLYVKSGLRVRRRNARLPEGGEGELLNSSLFGVRSVFVVQGEVYDNTVVGDDTTRQSRDTMIKGGTQRRERSRETVMENRRLGTTDLREKVVLFPDAPHHDMASTGKVGMVNIAQAVLRVDAKYQKTRRPRVMRAQAHVVEDSEEVLQETKEAKRKLMERLRVNVHKFNDDPLENTWGAIESSFTDAGLDAGLNDKEIAEGAEVYVVDSETEESENEEVEVEATRSGLNELNVLQE